MDGDTIKKSLKSISILQMVFGFTLCFETVIREKGIKFEIRTKEQGHKCSTLLCPIWK